MGYAQAPRQVTPRWEEMEAKAATYESSGLYTRLVAVVVIAEVHCKEGEEDRDDGSDGEPDETWAVVVRRGSLLDRGEAFLELCGLNCGQDMETRSDSCCSAVEFR